LEKGDVKSEVRELGKENAGIRPPHPFDPLPRRGIKDNERRGKGDVKSGIREWGIGKRRYEIGNTGIRKGECWNKAAPPL
jgi:hypothetical protein